MPMKPITVKANFQLDTSAARAQLQGLQRELNGITKSATSQLGVTQQITEAIKAAELLKQTLAEATNVNTGTLDLAKFTTSMRENMTSIEQMKKSLQTLGPEGEKAFNSLAMNIATAQVPLQRTSELFGQFKTAISNAMKWQVSSMAIHKVTAEISKAFNYAQNLDKSLTNISIITGHNADYMAKFAQNANKAAQALSASTLEYTNASLIYYQQGLSDKEVAKRAETTLKLAKVTGESASKVSQQMTAVWNNFSNGVDNLERYADVMTALGATTASSSSEIAKGLEKFASVTKTIGLSYDYAASALATVTAQTRQSADSVGTAFKTLFSRLESLNLGETLDDSTTLNKYSEALLKVGVNVMDVNGNLKNMDNILDELGGKWTSLNKAQQVALAQTVGGVRNYTSLITLMDNWQDFQNNVVTSQLAEGTLQKQADIYAKSWEAAQQRVTTAAQGIYDTLISSDFFKGVNNVTAFALNSISGLGRALGTSGSLAGLSMLINSAYKENLATGIDNLGNNILANTIYGQNQAIQVKQNMLNQLTEDISFNDKDLNIFREKIINQATTLNNDFLKDSKLFSTRAQQQTYGNLLMSTNAEGIQALNKLSDIDQFKTIDKAILKAQVTEDIVGLSRTQHIVATTSAENILKTIEASFEDKDTLSAATKSFRDIFKNDILKASAESLNGQTDTKTMQTLRQSIGSFISANFQGMTTEDFLNFYGGTSLAGAIDNILKGQFDNVFSGLSGAIASNIQTGSEKLDEVINDTVVKAGYTLDSDEGKELRKSISTFANNYQQALDKGYGNEFLQKYSAQQVIDKYGTLRGTVMNMATQPNGLLSVKQHQEENLKGEKVLKDNTMAMGQFAMQTAQMVNSMAMAANSISNFKKSIDSGDVSFSNFAATLGSTGLAIGTTLNMMQNNSALLGFMGGTTGKSIAGFLGKTPGIGQAFVGQEGGLSTVGAGLIAAAAAAALYAGIKGYEIYKANTIDSKISRANEDKITLNSLSKEDKQRYNTFLDVAQTQNENYGKLYNLQKNTSQYTSQLIDSNQQARDMIDTYSLKAGTDYSIDNQGAINFSAQQIANISERLLDQSQTTSMLAQLANSRITQLDAIKNNAYGMRAVSRVNVSGGEGVGNGMGVGAVTVEEKSEEEYQKELEQAKQDQMEASAIAKADYQVALQSVVSADDNVTNLEKLAVDILGSNISNAEDYAKQLYNVSKAGGITRNLTGEYLDEASLRNIYMQDEYFGEAAAANMTQQELAAAIEAKAAENILKAQIESLSNLDASAVSKYSNYSSMSINKLLNEVIKPNQDDDNYRSLNLMALNKIAGSQETLAQALFNNTNISDMNFATMADKMQQQLQLSVEQTENLANYINNFGTNFGDTTGQAILTALTGYDATTGKFGTGFNTDFYKELQNISTASSIASLADLEKRIGMIGNREVADQMRDLQKAMMADIDSRGGLAKTLFESSDFQDTFAKLSDVFQATGHITAQNIADLAAKNETLNGYLQATAEQSPMSGAQAVADIASLLASGSITTSDLTPAIAAFIEEASGTGRGSQQEAVDEAEEARKNLSDSITDTDKFYQEGGKLWYNAIKNDALLDAPLQEWFAQVLKPKDLEAINTIFNLGVTKDTDWMVNQIKTKLPEVYDMMTILQGGTSKKKAGKGGGGLDTYLAYLGSDSFLDAAGIKIEDNGRITFPGMPEGKSFEELYKEYMDQKYPDEKTHYMTENGIYEFVNDYFLGQGMSKSQASFIATQFVGRSASSSLGTVYQRNGILAGTDKLIEQLEKENGGSVTRAGIDALYDQYAAGMAGLWINPETGNIEALSDEQLAAGQGGIDRDQFRGYIAQQLREAGKAFIDASGLGMYGKSTDVQSIGKELADLSEGTIFGTGANAIVDAAVKYGVKRYRVQTPGQVSQMGNGAGLYEPEPSQMLGEAFDYEELQDFYTNVLGLSIETFQQHLPDIMQSLANNSIYGGNGHAALNYQYKDIFGAIHNINSSDAKYWAGGEFNVEQYNQDINTEKQKSEWDDFYNQKLMEQAYEEAYENNQNPENDYIDPYELYQQKIAAERDRRQAATNNTVNAYETNETVDVEGNFAQEQQNQIDSLKRQRETSRANGHWDEVREFDRQIAELEGTMPSGAQTNITGQTEALSAWDTASKEDKAGFVYSNRADAADIYNYWKQHPGMTQAQAYDDVVILGKKPEPPEGKTTTEPETTTTTTEPEATTTTTTEPEATTTTTTTEPEATTEPENPVASTAAAESPIDLEYIGNKVDEKVDTLTPDDRSLGERWADFTQGIGNGLKTVAGTVIGAILNPFGVKAEADIEEGKEAPFGNKPEAITDDTYNPTLGMTFGEWKAQKAQQEQQLQQAQLEQESQRQAWQNYQDALSAENDFLAENGDFVTNPENARLAAWTAAARENPDLLGALYQNALKEGYTGDQFTQMYDYQGLHGTTQSALSTAVGGIFNGSSVTAQQRFDFINNAYEKALTQGTTALSPFEKQVLTMIGEIDDNTGTLVEHGEEEGDAATRAKKNKQVNEEGELVDEEGNPIEMPQNQQPQGGGSGGRDSGDTSVGGRGGNASDPSGMGATTGADMRGTPAMSLFNQIIKDGGGAADLLGAGFTPEAVAEYYDSVNKVAEATGGKASGQNNARLLAYASGKEGHIAVTGELGPELRVKSDGSMDILGKTGREYAWVEPDDRIYTASQSAGILKSNKIPGLEGLAKGINNFIPGYDGGVVGGIVLNGSTSSDQGSSGSGGGGSSGGGGHSHSGGTPTETDPRYDPNTLKIRDVLERYYTILQKIDDITRAVEKFAKVADRAWGQDRIKAIEKQTALYQQQYDAQKKYVQEIGEYMNTDSAALTTMIREFVEGYNEGKEDKDKLSWAGAQFDSNGVLTNYRDFVEKLVEQYNTNAEANAQNKEAQYKFQEQLKDIQMYTDTLNLWESETDKLQELANQILDNSLKEITYRVEYELELNADQKRLLDFQDSFVKDDIFRVAEHISNMNEEIANTADSLEKTRKGLYDYLGTLAGENMRTGEFYDDVALGIATRDEQGLVSAKNYDDIDFKQVSNTVDSWIKKLSKEDAEEVNKIVQRDANGIITNYRDVVNKINEMNEKLSSDSISLLLNDAQQFFDKLSDLTNNPKWTGLSTEMKDQITNYMDQMIQYIQSMGAEFQEIVESMGDSIKAFGKKIDAEIDEFDYYGDVYKSFGNIIDLTNQHMTDITADFFNTLNSKALDNNINKIEAARRRYELFTKTLGDVQAQYNAMLGRLNDAQGAEEKAFYQQRVDELKEQLDIANSQMESAHKDFLQSWEDALSKIQESYKSAIEQASKDFEKGFSPLFNTLALLQAQFDREKALGDLYVDNYQKIHDLNKLNRDIDQSISDTDNLKSKGRLRDLQKEIRDLQEDGTELSEYDLDILDKKYKLELARQALEDARDAKSIVRLSRDNNGNWGYVYTADEDEIAEAEQNYEDAIRDMEEANQNYIDNIQDQILQVQQEAQQAILALQPEDFATYDDYLAAVQNIQNSMYQTLDYLRSQLNNAFGNNDWLETIVPGIVKDHDLTNDFANTPLAQLLVNGNLDSMIDSAKTNLQENLIQPALESFTIYSEKQKEVYAAAGKDMATIGQTFGKEMDTLTEKSEEQVDVVMKLADRVEDSFGKTMDAVIKATNDWLDKIKDVVKEYDILLEKITELKKIDGEYVEPHKTINGDNAVDTWEELDRFKRELADNGTINLITTDTATGKERATKYVAGSPEAQAFLDSVEEAAIKKDIIDLGDDDVNDNENNEVLAYLNAHKKVWVRFKGEELMFTSVEEWEAWRDKHKPAPFVDTGGGRETPWTAGGWTKDQLRHFSGGYLDTGGYTGRWQFADTGMYTGEWPMGSVRRNGRLAWLHQKELVLNAHDTENFLDAMQVVRQLDNLTNWMANGLGDLIMPKVTGTDNELEQNVHIEAEFPNVTDHNEIEQAFTNLVNMASQYANRK